MRMKYHFKIYKEKNGYSARGIELEYCFTQGDTLEELQQNMQEALNLHVDEPADSTDFAPFPNPKIKLSKTVVEVELDPHIAFAFLVRYCRIKHQITQKKAAQEMGFDTLYSYQRLESSKCNPSLKMLARLKKIFPEFSVDYILA